MKMLLIIIFLTLPLFGQEVTIDKKDNTIIEELLEIKDLMVDLEDRLHDDRHDTVVQLYGKEIEDRLEKLIKEYDGKIKKEKEEETKKEQSKENQNSEGKKPSSDSKLGAKTPAQVKALTKMPWMTKEYDDWAKLGDQRRSEIIQSYNEFEKIPLRWQQRIAAYFLSVSENDPQTILNKARMAEAKQNAKEDAIRQDEANRRNGTLFKRNKDGEKEEIKRFDEQ